MRTKGAIYEAVVEKLRNEGLDAIGIGVATLHRGPDHLVVRDGSSIGEYNHVSKKLTLYESE